ncbi:MAG: metallopeptidase TldD-related protein [Pseudomonadota bacterium]|nr:metallopeptidase TldD-related protein [Pseudomonadota bacterium]
MEDRARLVAVLEQAKDGGAKAAEVLRVRRVSLEQAGSRQAPAQREELAWTVRVWREGGAAGLGTSALSSDAVARALAASASAPPDLLAGPAERMAIRTGALGIDDHRHPQIAEEDRTEILAFAEKAFNQGGLKARSLRYRHWRDERAWMSTRGVEATESATSYEVSAEVSAGDATARHRIASRHFSDVASLPFGPELRRRMEPLTRPVAVPPGSLPLVLEPRLVADLVRALAPAFSAVSIGEGNFVSPLLGKRLASPLLHITDDAGLFGGLYTRAFDDRGVPPIAVALLKEGVVHGLYHDPESARAAGLRPTGHVTGGVLGPTNLIVRPGARTRNVILAELGRYLLLDRLPPIDLKAGRLRGEAVVVVVERAERVGSARVSFDVPLLTLLAGLREVAADQERSCEVDAPTAVFEGSVLTA